MSGVLNEYLRFDQLEKMERESFRLSPAPEHVRFEKGTKFYKWTTFPLYVKDRADTAKVKVSAFWCSKDEFKTPGGRVVPGFNELRKRYGNTGGSVAAPRDFARARNAVRQDWNKMDALLFMQLDQVVWGFAGITGTQPYETETEQQLRDIQDRKLASVRWIGGDWQIVMPGMNETHCHQIG